MIVAADICMTRQSSRPSRLWSIIALLAPTGAGGA